MEQPSINPATAPPPPGLLTQRREWIRLKHHSLSTEQSYVGRARRFVLLFYGTGLQIAEGLESRSEGSGICASHGGGVRSLMDCVALASSGPL